MTFAFIPELQVGFPLGYSKILLILSATWNGLQQEKPLAAKNKAFCWEMPTIRQSVRCKTKGFKSYLNISNRQIKNFTKTYH